MFSGITRGTFPIVHAEHSSGLFRYAVQLSSSLVYGLEVGASVAVDGVCQTAVAIDGTLVHFDAIAETLRCTTLGERNVGDAVSIERSVRAGDELGGHELSGHVTGTGRVHEVTQVGGEYQLWVEVPRDWLRYLFPKGFVALDGSSLTVGALDRPRARFSVYLIPETLRVTNLGRKSVGDRVNVELDARTVAIVDTVERVLEERGQA